MEVFDAILAKPVTYEELKRRLAEDRQQAAGDIPGE